MKVNVVSITKKEKKLLEIIDDILWMAIRYADGRHTYAPEMVRDAVNYLRKTYPKFNLRPDSTIKKPQPGERGYFLYDLF